MMSMFLFAIFVTNLIVALLILWCTNKERINSHRFDEIEKQLGVIEKRVDGAYDTLAAIAKENVDTQKIPRIYITETKRT